MEELLDQVEWSPVSAPDASGDLFATHSGILEIGEFELRVFRLNDGQAIILKEDFERFFGCGLGLPE